LRVLCPFPARPDRPADTENPFVARLAERLVRRRVLLRVRDDLRDAVPVAQVDERELAVIAAGVHPAGEGHFLPSKRGARLAAGVRPQHLVAIVLEERRLACGAGLVLVGILRTLE